MPTSLVVRLIALCLGSAALLRGSTILDPSTAAPGERLLLNEGWRFHVGDPADLPTTLMYDVRRRAVLHAGDGQPTLSQDETQRVTVEKPALILKPWVLPTGNRFIKDPARRHVRPTHEPAVDLPVTRAEFDDTGWQQVTLPHDWAIGGPFTTKGGGGMGRLPSAGVGWYRRTVDLPAADSGKSVFLEIDGAMAYAVVWVNGRIAGGWPYGYSSWRVDLTPYVRFGGGNQIAIRLDNPPDSSRWYPGGGIYRNVWLVKSLPVHVAQWGTHVLARDVSPETATIEVQVTLANDGRTAAAAEVNTELFEATETGRPAGKAVAHLPVLKATVPATGEYTVTATTTVPNPKLWGPRPTQQPNRYVAVSTVTVGGKVTDRHETPFGIRTLRFDPNAGLYVNGERIYLKGVNQHHDLGALGAAFHVRAAERQLRMLADMGCNAIRLSHNPPAPELLELTDRLGFLVMDEAFDMWVRNKTPLDFHLVYPDWHEQDLRAMLRRDRNHPSIFMWSVGNEVGEQYTAEDGAAVAKRLCDIVHEEDPVRPATSAMNFAKPDMALPAVLDVISLNYQGEGIRDTPEFEGTNRIRTPPLYGSFHEAHPAKVILSTETASAFSSRGIYLFPVTKDNSSPVRDGRGGDSTLRHVSAYELYAVDFGSSADKVFAAQDKHPFVAGEFVWTGWDYLGEPTPYDTSRSSYCGIIDLAGFKKDRFYLYQSRWRPELPMAHILPHWTWPDRAGQVTPVHIFTSGDEAELFLNGRSLGRKKKGPYEYRLRWDNLVYEPGTLEVVAYRQGKKWATDVVQTTTEPTAVAAHSDRERIRGDGVDLAFVTLSIVDQEGRLAPRADNRLTFSVEGPGEIVATDNGDPTNLESFHSRERNAFSGLALVIVRGKRGQTGEIKVTASGAGLKPGTALIRTE